MSTRDCNSSVAACWATVVGKWVEVRIACSSVTATSSGILNAAQSAPKMHVCNRDHTAIEVLWPTASQISPSQPMQTHRQLLYRILCVQIGYWDKDIIPKVIAHTEWSAQLWSIPAVTSPLRLAVHTVIWLYTWTASWTQSLRMTRLRRAAFWGL